jgi:tRNA-specific 2-thiouridylase
MTATVNKNSNKTKRVLIGLSGGVDSSVSAYLLKKQGFYVEGVYLKLHSNENYHEKNLIKIDAISKFLDIKYTVLDKQNIFKNRVFDYFIDEYVNGRTPNPCIVCNKNIKFGEFFDYAMANNFDFIATGHYLKTDSNFIYVADDDSKDQSYFLFDINREVLKKVIFPLSNYKKDEVKKIADSINSEFFKSLAVQKESNEICFVEDTYIEILKNQQKKIPKIEQQGEVLNNNSEIIGTHKGYMQYTIGKRRGFTVNGALTPHYVLKILPETNQIIVGEKDELAQNSVILENLNMFIDDKKFTASVKLRYRSKGIEADVIIKNNRAYLTLKEPFFGVAKGQAGVFYQNNKLIGGGWIT